MYKPQFVTRFVKESIARSGNPLGIHPSELRWWDGLKLSEPKSGRRILFTGMLYQLSPYLSRIAGMLLRFEETFIERAAESLLQFPLLQRLLSMHISRVSREEKEYYNGIVKKIALNLLKRKIEYTYDPRLDLYSGILLHDLGLENEFVNHASRVAKVLNEGEVWEVITIDPHTTYALKVLYPEYINFEIQVKTYFELLEKRSNSITKPEKMYEAITLHDPCYYGRYLELSDVPRRILETFGIEIIEVRNSGKLTSCCGGPVESFSPNLSGAMAKHRAEELDFGCKMVTMCPICLSNFRRVKAPFVDFAELLGGT